MVKTRRTDSSNSESARNVLSVEPTDAPDYLLEPGYINRRMLIQALGISVSEFRSLSARGLVKAAKRNRRGWWLYHEDTVEHLKEHILNLNAERSNTSTKLLPAAKDPNVPYSTDEGHTVFTLLNAGKCLIDVFVETKIHPAVINAIVKDYERLGGSIFVGKSIIDAINKMPLRGVDTIRSADDILTAFRKYCDEDYEVPSCTLCDEQRCNYCISCAAKAKSNADQKESAKKKPRESQPAASSSQKKPADG